MSLQRRLDALIVDFTRDILEVIGRSNLAEIAPLFGQRPPPRLAPAPQTRARVQTQTQPQRRSVPPKPKSAPAPVRVEGAARAKPESAPVAHVTPDARTLERMLLGAMRGAAPMNREDVLDSAAVSADDLEAARKVLDGLVERGIIGTANLSGAPLLFIKPTQSPRRRAAKEKPASLVAVAAEPAAETWKPTVIRRKKASAEETAPANDDEAPASV